jgi:hypothetical protein
MGKLLVCGFILWEHGGLNILGTSIDTLLHGTQVNVVIGADGLIVKGKDSLLVIEQLVVAVVIGSPHGVSRLIIDIELQG